VLFLHLLSRAWSRWRSLSRLRLITLRLSKPTLLRSFYLTPMRELLLANRVLRLWTLLTSISISLPVSPHPPPTPTVLSNSFLLILTTSTSSKLWYRLWLLRTQCSNSRTLKLPSTRLLSLRLNDPRNNLSTRCLSTFYPPTTACLSSWAALPSSRFRLLSCQCRLLLPKLSSQSQGSISASRIWSSSFWLNSPGLTLKPEKMTILLISCCK